MSEHQIVEETPEPRLLHREFAATVTAGEGRTVDVLIVPYGEQIEHNDGFGGVPKGVVYREEWVPGVFDHQGRAADKVLANCEHEEGIQGVVGRGTHLEERPDGFYGSFKMLNTQSADTALELIREGVFSAVSLEARPRKSQRTAAGLVRRIKADLVNVAFTRFGAYKRAGVLAVREQADEMILVDEEMQIVELDPKVLERCRALGVALPQRYEAHPETGTPSPEGTPDAAPAEPVQTTDSEE